MKIALVTVALLAGVVAALTLGIELNPLKGDSNQVPSNFTPAQIK